jgi:deoxyribodipyrimidine photo-lyase
MKKAINVLWLRRDLRVTDHLALREASLDGLPLFVFFTLPTRTQYSSTWSQNHLRFVIQALHELQENLTPVHYFEWEASDVISSLNEIFQIKGLYSHHLCLERDDRESDQLLKGQLDKLQIPWHQIPERPTLLDRPDKNRAWHHWIQSPLTNIDQNPSWLTLPDHLALPKIEEDSKLAIGTRTQGLLKLRKHCDLINQELIKWRSETSEISPYLSWGLFSLRETYQLCAKWTAQCQQKKAREQFLKRLQWQTLLMDQFDQKPDLEFESSPLRFTKEAKKNFKKWKTASTGEPLIDACLRCVIETGQLSFKKRSLIVSYLTHHLKVPWPKGATFLARCFLDYHPGIHYPQFHRVLNSTPYNIQAQKKKLDPKGDFQARWCPPRKDEQGDNLFDSNTTAPL